MHDKEHVPALRRHVEGLELAPLGPRSNTMLTSRLNGLPTGMACGHCPFK